MDNPHLLQPWPRRWWVFFGEAEQLGWLRIFTKRGWRHCFAVTTLADDVPIVINPSRPVLEITLPLATTAETVARFRQDGYRCLVVSTTEPDYNLAKHCIVKSCATVVAYSLGIGTWAITPRQLWRRLLREGAREVK